MNPSQAQTPMSDREHVWEDRRTNVRLDVEPRELEGEEKGLTYGMWITALSGIEDFVEHYPRLIFGFEIYHEEYDDKGEIEAEYFVGYGNLGWYSEPWTSQA